VGGTPAASNPDKLRAHQAELCNAQSHVGNKKAHVVPGGLTGIHRFEEGVLVIMKR